MSVVWLRKQVSGWVPDDDAAKAQFRKAKLGETYRAEIRRPRSLKFHKKFFALINVVWETCGDWATVDELLDELKFRVGYVDRQRVIDRKTGEVLAEIIKPKSIAFHNMGEDEFHTFYERCMDTIVTDMVPNISRAALRDEVLRAMQ